MSNEEITGLDSDILLGTLQVYADGTYQVELWCPVDAGLRVMAEAIKDLHDNSEDIRTESRRLGYEK